MKRNAHKKAMRIAIAQARKGMHKGQTPFGSCYVREGKIISAKRGCVRR